MKAWLYRGLCLLLALALPLRAGVHVHQPSDHLFLLQVTTTQEAQLQPRSLEPGTFVRVQVEGFGVTSELGNPRVPVLRRFFLAASPEELQVTVKVVGRRTVSLGNTPLEPVQPPVPKVPNPQVPFVQNRAVYQQTTPYPGFLWQVKPAGTLRDQPLVVLEVYPVQYHPARNEVELLDLEVQVQVPAPTPRHPWKLSTPFLAQLKRLVLNPEALLRVPPAPVGYLILVPDAYISAIQPYADWLTAKGYFVTLTPLSAIGSNPTATEIRAYIQNAYATWDVPPTFVLLVGDVDQIPNFTGQGEGTPDTDLNYGMMDDTDYFPDLYVGRFSVSSASELSQVVNKALAYQQTAWANGRAWAQRAYFMASDDASFHQVAEGTHLYAMGIVRAHGMIADSLFEYYGTGTPVATALNDGRSLAIYSGHGYEQGWAGPSFDISDIYSLSNTDRYPMVQSYACLTGSYAAYDECFMEAWLRAPDKGAVVALGSSVTSYWDEDDVLERRMFDAQFDSAITWVMGFVNHAKMALYEYYGNTDRVRRYFEMYNLFGDPALDLFTQVPETLYVSHEGTLPPGNHTVSVTVSDPQGVVAEALVGIRNRQDSLLASGYTNASGRVDLSVSLDAGDTLWVTTTAHNHAPAYTQIVAVAEGPYVTLVSWTLSDENGDQHPNPDEAATLITWVKNVGTQAAYDVVSTLQAPAGVSVSDPQVSLGTLAPGDSVEASYALAFAPTLRDQQQLPFTLKFTYGFGDSSASPFSMVVYAPNLVLGEVTLQDSNGNGIAEAGERITLFPTTRNDGHLDIPNVTGVLRSSDPYITLMDTTASYGDVAVGSEAPGSGFVFRSDPATPLHHSATFVVEWSSGFYSFADTFQVTIGVGGQFLVWDPDPNHSSGPVIYSILRDSLGYQGDYTTDLAAYANDLPYYQSLFVCVGMYSDNYRILEGSQEAQWIEDYLAQGGNVYLEGGDVWYFDPASANGHDFGPSFGIQATADGSNDLATVEGVDGTFTQGMSFPYAGENAWVDHLEPGNAGAFMIFENSTPTYGCGVAYDAGTYRTVGLSFELAGLSDNPAGHKVLLLQNIMDFFLESTGSPPDLHLSPESFSAMAQVGDSAVRTLVIQNLGERTLWFQIQRQPSSRRLHRFAYLPKAPPGKGTPEAQGFPPEKGAGGPDGFGYRWQDSQEPGGPTFDWVEISDIGTALNLGDDDDAVVDLPWAFPFYGTPRTTVRVSSNGYLTFGTDGTDYTNDPIPNADPPNAFIAPFWDDLNPSTSGEVYTYYDTETDRFIVEWYQVPHYGASSPYTFEVILYPDGRILFQYLDLQGDLTSATVGIENDEGSDGLLVVYNAAYLANGLAVEIYALPPWLRVSPEGGTVPPGEQAEIRVVMDASALEEGTYTDTLYVHSNDPDEPVVAVPVTFTVTQWLYGDLDGDGQLTAADVEQLATYLYAHGPAPDPYDLGDVNRDGVVNDLDLVALSRQVLGKVLVRHRPKEVQKP